MRLYSGNDFWSRHMALAAKFRAAAISPARFQVNGTMDTPDRAEMIRCARRELAFARAERMKGAAVQLRRAA